MLAFILVCLSVSVVAHSLIRNYWSAVSLAAVTTSLVNMAHEAYLTNFQARPVDVLFWGPMTIAVGTFVAFPIAVIVGCPFHLVRRKSPKQQGSIQTS